MEKNQRSSDQVWIDYANRLKWEKPWTTLKETSFIKPVSIKWFLNGKLNVSVNCIDRHLEAHANDIALIFEPDDINASHQKVTYLELHKQVCRLGNVLRSRGVKKGDRVTIYMPMILESVYAMLACARIGAVHSVVFGGFSAESLAGRILDCESDFIITAEVGHRGGKIIPLKQNVDEAVALCKKENYNVRHVLVIGGKTMGSDLDYSAEVANASEHCVPEVMDSEDPLFILYTSGSTGKPKGVLHTTGGYLAYVSATHEKVFGYKPGETYWCTADVGWITGHSYIVYGPLSNRATTVVFEGVPSYPTPARFWQVIEKHRINIFYTAPTAIRALMREDLKYIQHCDLSSLRLLGSVGEPINPEAWLWYQRNIGGGKCPVVDTWWQTETGGILIAPTSAGEIEKMKSSPHLVKPGSATQPLAGIDPAILDPKGSELTGACEGLLVLKNSWPGQARTVYKDHKRFEETYFSAFPGFYFTGDGCKRDQDGFYWITGRVDDVINVSGHRIGTAEVESALVAHTKVAEAAVVGFPHDIKGQGIYAFVTLKTGIEPTQALRLELIQEVRKHIGAIASPDKIQWAPGLPKTRSGKIMRRILRKIAENQFDQLGDISTLADPSVVDQLISNRI